jgi:hypothetical protein
MTGHSLTVVVLAVLVGTVAVARATRLVTSDAYPPAVWVRRQWVNATGSRHRTQDWAPLAECPFCFAPYAAAVDLTWAVWSGAAGDPGMWSWGGWWWLVNVWAAVSYVAAMIVVRDEPPAED